MKRFPFRTIFVSVFTTLLGAAGCSGGSSTPSAPAPPSPPPALPQISLAAAATGFAQPVHVTHSGDGSNRIFVVEQAGRIRILANGVVLQTPFLDIASVNPPRLVAGGERGLLSVAFPPGFAVKRHFYVYYTRAADGAIVVARYRVSAGDGNVADPATGEEILVVPHPGFGNHNGGQLAFGPDGPRQRGGAGDPVPGHRVPAGLLRRAGTSQRCSGTPWSIHSLMRFNSSSLSWPG